MADVENVRKAKGFPQGSRQSLLKRINSLPERLLRRGRPAPFQLSMVNG